MGTKSIVRFYDEFKSNKPILSVYQQFDGYINGVGRDLAIFLKDKVIINGINNQTMKDGFANGMGCLAAQFVAEKKNKIGEFYITSNDDLQEYNYEVRFINNKLIIKIDNFEGTPEELLTYIRTIN